MLYITSSPQKLTGDSGAVGGGTTSKRIKGLGLSTTVKSIKYRNTTTIYVSNNVCFRCSGMDCVSGTSEGARAGAQSAPNPWQSIKDCFSTTRVARGHFPKQSPFVPRGKRYLRPLRMYHGRAANARVEPRRERSDRESTGPDLRKLINSNICQSISDLSPTDKNADSARYRTNKLVLDHAPPSTSWVTIHATCHRGENVRFVRSFGSCLRSTKMWDTIYCSPLLLQKLLQR
ncbi:hypothetical protein EVAR_43458_1 [Eumeta japonica]|uniref:Uncharacterized protein n=1 Tax=Eumeta variegata TaxID=151549 RepID=A0A4C1YD04_EUMVA|nr:hypothetical protein EVAR_43458_1 [Eumeta japonica]